MNLAISASIDIYSIVLLVFIYIHAMINREKDIMQQKLYIGMLQVTLLILVFDILSRCDGHPGSAFTFFNYWGNLFIFMLCPVLPAIWLVYTYYQIYKDEKKAKRLKYPLIALSAVNILITIISQFLGWYYTIDSENIYHRGKLYWVSPTIVILLVLISLYLVIANRKVIDRKYYFSLSFFPILPLICFILQSFVYRISLVFIGTTISLMVAFFHIQNHNINTDYLTGAYNRKKLESYMRGKIKASTDNNTFSAILVDIDNFKSINDTYGHDEGDSALETSVILIKNCIRTTDLIARFGGDEFYVILNISNLSDLEATVHRIIKCLLVFNQQGIKPYQLSFSFGYAVYDYQSHLSVEAFQKQVDMQMYENKRANKVLTSH